MKPATNRSVSKASSTSRLAQNPRIAGGRAPTQLNSAGHWRNGATSSDKTAPVQSEADMEFRSPVQPRVVACLQSDGQDPSVEEYDILGLGQLMIDYAAAVDEEVLSSLNVPKGGRRVITVEERAAVMERLQGFTSQVSAGGSLANSLVGISQLAAARERFLTTTTAAPQHISAGNGSSSAAATASPQHRIRVAMAGCCGGTDALGEFGRAQMAAAGVDIVPVGDPGAPWTGSATGTVMVFTTPDAQRSFLSSFSSEDRLHLTQQLLDAVSRARLVVIEGYLWELPGAAEVIPAVVKHAQSVGTLVVLTAGDASVVQRHGEKVLGVIQQGVDMFVSNVAEAQALAQFLQQQQPQDALQQQVQEMGQHSILLDPQGSASLDSLWEHSSSGSTCSSGHAAVHGSSSEGQVVACELAGVCPLVVVTDGSRGSYITALSSLIVVPPYWRSKAPIDTCGAGDGYCSGFLFAFLLGLDLHAMGHVAAKTASAVISRHGPQLLPADADSVAGVPLGRCGGLAAHFMAGASSRALDGVYQLESLGLGLSTSVDAVQVLQGAGP